MAAVVRRCLIWYLVVAMLIIGITPRAYAGFSPSEGIGLSPSERSADIKKLQKFLEMKMVGGRLRELGLTTDEVKARVGELDDGQLHQVALKIDDLKVGADSGIGILAALAVIVILVIILVFLLQHRIVIK